MNRAALPDCARCEALLVVLERRTELLGIVAECGDDLAKLNAANNLRQAVTLYMRHLQVRHRLAHCPH